MKLLTAVSLGPPQAFKSLAVDVPFYWHTENWRDIDREGGNLREKLQYRADRRNEAVSTALERNPDTTDIIMIDSFYLGQPELGYLVERYERLENGSAWLTLLPVTLASSH